MKQRFSRWYALARDILIAASHKYGVDRVNRMAAAIAYRTVFALAPLLIIAIAILGAFVGGSDTAQAQIISTISEFAGPQMADLMDQFLTSALQASNTAAVIGVALLFWSASSLFLEMQHDLNDIFEVPYESISGVVNLVKKRGIGFLWAFGLGLTILALWLVNALWGLVQGLFPDDLVWLHRILGVAAVVVSLAVLPFVFGLVFRTMIAVRVRWRAVWWGGLFTASVFLLAAYGIGLYFSLFDKPSALGFASSLVIVLILAYLLSAVFLFGAVMTKLYSDHLNRLEGSDVGGANTRPEIVLAEAPTAVPKAAILAFLSGLVLGWGRSRR